MSDDHQAIIDTVAGIFRAIKEDDAESFFTLLSEDFFIHENGARFDSHGIFDLIADAQHAGAVFEWEVTNAVVHQSGDLATLAYVNQGAVTRAGERQPVHWLETAVLSREHGIWSVAYMTSMRVTESAIA